MGTSGVGRAGRSKAVVVIVALTALAAGCASSAPRRGPAPFVPADRPRVALLPLENLSNEADASEAFGRVLFTELVRTGCCEAIEPGLVESALDSLGIRYTGALTVADVRGLSERLRAAYVIVGTVLESGTVRTPEGDVPSAAVTLRMLEPDSARVVWADAGYRTGQDRETVFGYGRERNAQRLQAALAAELLRPFRTERTTKQGRNEP